MSPSTPDPWRQVPSRFNRVPWKSPPHPCAGSLRPRPLPLRAEIQPRDPRCGNSRLGVANLDSRKSRLMNRAINSRAPPKAPRPKAYPAQTQPARVAFPDCPLCPLVPAKLRLRSAADLQWRPPGRARALTPRLMDRSAERRGRIGRTGLQPSRCAGSPIPPGKPVTIQFDNQFW